MQISQPITSVLSSQKPRRLVEKSSEKYPKQKRENMASLQEHISISNFSDEFLLQIVIEFHRRATKKEVKFER